MYVATIPNRNSPPALLLRESFRQNGKVKNRTLANLSHWPAARIEALRRLLRGEFDQAADLSLAPQLGPVFGLLFVLQRMAEGLGSAAGADGEGAVSPLSGSSRPTAPAVSLRRDEQLSGRREERVGGVRL